MMREEDDLEVKKSVSMMTSSSKKNNYALDEILKQVFQLVPHTAGGCIMHIVCEETKNLH